MSDGPSQGAEMSGAGGEARHAAERCPHYRADFNARMLPRDWNPGCTLREGHPPPCVWGTPAYERQEPTGATQGAIPKVPPIYTPEDLYLTDGAARELALAEPFPEPEPASVVQTWLFTLPFKQQATVLVALRGCDGLPKRHPSKKVVAYLRSCVLNPADANWRENKDPFFGERPEVAEVLDFWRAMDEYPLHWFLHLVHAAEVLGYKHPDEEIRDWWRKVYLRSVTKMHLFPEKPDELEQRLGRGSGG